MEPIYSAAKSIVNRAQPSLDGGLVTFILHNFVRLPPPDSDTFNFTFPTDVKLTDHIFITYSRTGYALGIVFGLIWIVCLLIAQCLVCRQRKHSINRSSHLLYLAGRSTENTDTLTVQRSSPRSTFSRARQRLQSNWVCLAIQFFVMCLLAILLVVAILLGIAACAEYHANLSAPPTHEESVGRVLTPAELAQTNPTRTHVFPRLLRCIAQIRGFLTEFVGHTKKNTEPVVNALISATEKMQERMTDEFNAILFKDIGVTEAFELGDNLGVHVISLMKNSLAIVEANNAFKTNFDRFKLEFQSWLRLINSLMPLDEYSCTGPCEELRSTFINNLTVRPDSFMPHFDFAIALKFVTSDQNQTAETVQAQLNHGKVLSDRQLAEAKRMMNQRLDIPGSIRNLTNRQWDVMGSQIEKVVELIDEHAPIMFTVIAPKISAASSLILALNLFFWIPVLIVVIGFIWLIVHFHCIPSALSLQAINRVRLVAITALVLLVVSMALSMWFFLLGGYFQTEVCRYLTPKQNLVSIPEYDPVQKTYVNSLMFPIDAHINAFLSRNWASVVALNERMTPPGAKPPPLPRVRNPISGVSVKCRENLGLLEATDAIRSFDMSALNDPEMTDKFVSMGKEIMIESLRSINIDEMFPKETDEQLGNAARLDDFIVDFPKYRSQLPKTYLSVQIATEDASSTMTLISSQEMWTLWDKFYSEILQYRLSVEQLDRLNTATEKVRELIVHMDAIIDSMDGNLAILSKATKVGPLVSQLQIVLVKLKAFMSDKEALVARASALYEEHVAAKTPIEAGKLIAHHGPSLLAEVGRCQRLYDAASDISSAMCEGVVDVMNGFWFLTGWVALIGTITVALTLLFLLHKNQPAHMSRKRLLIGSSHRRENKINNRFDPVGQTPGTDSPQSTGFCPQPCELEALNKPDQEPRESRTTGEA